MLSLSSRMGGKACFLGFLTSPVGSEARFIFHMINKIMILGIDNGTTQTTALVINNSGQILKTHSVPVTATFPQPGWVEQDPTAILDAVRQACAPLLTEFDIRTVLHALKNF